MTGDNVWEQRQNIASPMYNYRYFTMYSSIEIITKRDLIIVCHARNILSDLETVFIWYLFAFTFLLIYLNMQINQLKHK